MVIDDLHARDSGTPEGVGTQFAAAKGNKAASGVKCNALTTYDGLTIGMRVKSGDESDVEFIKKGYRNWERGWCSNWTVFIGQRK